MSRDMTKPSKWLCTQRRLRSAWASAQSYQSLRHVLNGLLRTQAFFMRTAKTLIRLGGCPVWSESSLGAHSFAWFCHVTAHMYFVTSAEVIFFSNFCYLKTDHSITNCKIYFVFSCFMYDGRYLFDKISALLNPTVTAVQKDRHCNITRFRNVRYLTK